MPPHPVLVIQHEGGCPPGRLTRWAEKTGTLLDVRSYDRGDSLPSGLADHGGVVVLGGQMSVYDEAKFPWLVPTKSLVIQAVLQRVPFLGLCLGHQLAGLALGARVVAHPHGRVRSVQQLDPVAGTADDPIMAGLRRGDPLIQWNAEALSDPPGGSQILSYDRWGQIQIIRFGPRAWGVQGHPEADAAIVASWADAAGGAGPAGPGAGDDECASLLAEIAAADERIEATWAPVLARFFALTRRPREDPSPGSLRADPA